MLTRTAFAKTAIVGAAAAFAAALIAPAPAVAAGPPEIDHFTDSDSHIEQEAHPGWCDGSVPFDVRWDFEAQGTFVGHARGDGLWYGAATYRATEVYTNVENDLTFTRVFRGGDRDALVVDNGDGTLTITVRNMGSSQYVGPDGKTLLRDNGMYTFSFLIDHNGTPGDPSDDVDVEDGFLGLEGPYGRFDTWNRDFCADIVEFLG